MITVRTVLGQQIDLEDPKPHQIDPREIAKGLSHVCRYAGQMPFHYSVAQHTLMVMALVDWELQPHALHHDDTEAYMCDIPRNLKHSDLMGGYRLIEDRLDRVIHTRFGLLPLIGERRDALKAADDLAAVFERWCILDNQPWARPEDILIWAKENNFVGSPLPLMARLLPRMTIASTPWHPMSHTLAEAVWLQHHRRFELERRVNAAEDLN